MKSYYYSIAIVVLSFIGVFSCKKDPSGKPNTFSATLNGVAFQGELIVSKRPDNTTSFFIRRYGQDGCPELEIAFSYIIDTPGKYNLFAEYADSSGIPYSRPNAQLFATQGCDALCGAWTISPSDSLTNILTVEDLANPNELSGTFSVSFIKVANCQGRIYPERMQFSNGKFHFYY